jgi:hypothetical protein
MLVCPAFGKRNKPAYQVKLQQRFAAYHIDVDFFYVQTGKDKPNHRVLGSRQRHILVLFFLKAVIAAEITFDSQVKVDRGDGRSYHGQGIGIEQSLGGSESAS